MSEGTEEDEEEDERLTYGKPIAARTNESQCTA